MHKNTDTRIIPRKTLCSNNSLKTEVKISPDGKRIAYIALLNGFENIFIAESDNMSNGFPVTNYQESVKLCHEWAYTNEHILIMQVNSVDGNEFFDIYCIDLKTKKAKKLNPFDKIQAIWMKIDYIYPEHIMAGFNNRNPRFHDIYKLNILTGDIELVYENNGFSSFIFDKEYNIRFGVRSATDEGNEIVRFTGNKEGETVIKIPLDDFMTTMPLCMANNDTELVMFDTRNRNIMALISFDAATGKEKAVFESDKGDISDFMLNPVTGTIEGVASNYLRKKWKFYAPDIESDCKFLSNLVDGDMSVLSRTMDDSVWIVAFDMDKSPTRFYRYNRITKNAEFIFSENDELLTEELYKLTPVVIKSRDGLDLVSYYTMPAKTEKERPDKGWPTVLHVHGGPWARNKWGFKYLHQLLANRGYFVLCVNYRGSTGFGKDFLNAGSHEYSGKIQEDLQDAVEWAVKNGYTDPAKVAIMGASFGGYAALMGLCLTPEAFACGISISGASDLISCFKTLPAYRQDLFPSIKKHFGDFLDENGQEIFDEQSPHNKLNRIKKPILTVHGKDDAIVRHEDYDKLVQDMNQNNLEATCLFYPDEAHGVKKPDNRLSLYAVIESFLAKNLGGLCEPISDYELRNSSLQVTSATAFLPELSSYK